MDLIFYRLLNVVKNMCVKFYVDHTDLVKTTNE